MTAQQPGRRRLAEAIRKLGQRRHAVAHTECPRGTVPDCRADCSRPDAPADLPTTHGLQLASIEGRLLKLENQVSNQNRILLIGVLAVVGDLLRQMLKP